MKDQALIKNEYVNFFYEQIELEKKLEGRELKLARKKNLIGTLPGIKDVKKEMVGIISIENNGEGHLFTAANISTAYGSPHAEVQSEIEKKLKYMKMKHFKEALPIGVTLLLAKDTGISEKLIVLLDKPELTENIFEPKIYAQYNGILRDYGVNLTLVLMTNKNYSPSTKIEPINASSIIDFYTNEVVL